MQECDQRNVKQSQTMTNPFMIAKSDTPVSDCKKGKQITLGFNVLAQGRCTGIKKGCTRIRKGCTDDRVQYGGIRPSNFILFPFSPNFSLPAHISHDQFVSDERN